MVPEQEEIALRRREQMQRDVDHGKFYLKENNKQVAKPPLAKNNHRPQLMLSKAIFKLQISNEILD